MFKDFEENIYGDEIERIYLSFFSNKLRVGVIGGGKAAIIKIKSFLKKNVYVEVLSKEFSKDILDINDKNLKLIKSEYKNEFIQDKHIIVIAINDIDLLRQIKNECDKIYKLYINCTDFKDGIGAMPVQRNLRNISLGINTNGGNPKGALLAADIAYDSLKSIDDFIGHVTILRNNAKKLKFYKSEIIEFLNCNDFKFFFDKGKDKNVFKLFLEDDDLQYLYRGEINGNSYSNKEEYFSSSSSR